MSVPTKSTMLSLNVCISSLTWGFDNDNELHMLTNFNDDVLPYYYHYRYTTTAFSSMANFPSYHAMFDLSS